MLGLSTRGIVDGQSALLAEDFRLAEKVLRDSCNALERIGEMGHLSTIVCLLGDALYELGKIDEADSCSVRGEDLGAPEDLATQISWRRVRAKVRAHRGQLDETIALAREAQAISESTEGLLWQAYSATTLAEVLGLAGHKGEALTSAHTALDRYERKGAVPSIKKTRSLIARLEQR